MLRKKQPIGMGCVPKMMYLIYKAEHHESKNIYLIGNFSEYPIELKDMPIQEMFARCGLYYDTAVVDMERGCEMIFEFDPESVELVDYETLNYLSKTCDRMIRLEF